MFYVVADLKGVLFVVCDGRLDKVPASWKSISSHTSWEDATARMGNTILMF